MKSYQQQLGKSLRDYI
jgi:hypothetical protein